MNTRIIEIKQLPIIEERLKDLKADIESRTSAAVAVDCTEKNYKEVKKIRADLNKECKEYEERRKAVKKAILAPYEAFETVYKKCVTKPFEVADGALKAKIDNIESGLKRKKQENVLKFAEELKAAYSLDWLDIKKVLPSITLSASEASLIQKAAEKIERIDEDVKAITDVEVLAEYKKLLNLAQAQAMVNTRRKEIELAKAETQRKAQQEEIKREVERKVEVLAPPTVEELPKERKMYKMTFTVSGTKDQLKALKAFIIENNIQIVGGN